MAEADEIPAIRRLNDEFRRTGRGGRMMMTSGIEALGSLGVKKIVEAVRAFDDFKAENDPYGEHDFGALVMDGCHVFWKIDYYGCDLKAHSPDPADPGVTIRVMTIMLAEEY